MKGNCDCWLYSNHCAFLLCDLVQEVNQRFPLLNLLLREDTTNNLLAALRHGELDILILALPVDIDGMESEIVGNDPFRMIISRNQATRFRLRLNTTTFPMNLYFCLKRTLFNRTCRFCLSAD